MKFSGRGGVKVDNAVVKEALEKQMKLLSECAEDNKADWNALCVITNEMGRLAQSMKIAGLLYGADDRIEH